jgi:hypothetical protein
MRESTVFILVLLVFAVLELACGSADRNAIFLAAAMVIAALRNRES